MDATIPQVIKTLAIGSLAGGGIGAASHAIHHRDDPNRSMLGDITRGALTGAMPGALAALSWRSPASKALRERAGEMVWPRTAEPFAVSAATGMPAATAAGILGDQLITGGQHPGVGILAGALGSIPIRRKIRNMYPLPERPMTWAEKAQAVGHAGFMLPAGMAMGQAVVLPIAMWPRATALLGAGMLGGMGYLGYQGVKKMMPEESESPLLTNDDYSSV